MGACRASHRIPVSDNIGAHRLRNRFHRGSISSMHVGISVAVDVDGDVVNWRETGRTRHECGHERDQRLGRRSPSCGLEDASAHRDQC